MDFNKTFYWTIQLKQAGNNFDEKMIISLLDSIAHYIPEFNDYGKFLDNDIINYVLRTNRNTGRFQISSRSIDFYFDTNESNRNWFDYPKIIYDVIYNSEIVLPLTIDHIKRSSIVTFSTKINHGVILQNLFMENSKLRSIVGSNKIMSFIPDIRILLDKENSIYNVISFKSDSSNIEDMENSYLKSEDLIIWYEVLKFRGFSSNYNFSKCFENFEKYFDGTEYDLYISNIEKPIYDIIKTNENLLNK